METKRAKREWVNINGLICLKSDNQKVIANTYANRFGSFDSRANAKLIAAAPDLLEALEKMCEWHEKMATWDKGDNGYYIAKRAIRKATE